jgi:hypothetical protein
MTSHDDTTACQAGVVSWKTPISDNPQAAWLHKAGSCPLVMGWLGGASTFAVIRSRCNTGGDENKVPRWTTPESSATRSSLC